MGLDEGDDLARTSRSISSQGTRSVGGLKGGVSALRPPSTTKRSNATFLSRQSKRHARVDGAGGADRNEKSNEEEDIYSYGVISWAILTC